MHSLFAALFAMLLSFCHHSALATNHNTAFAYGNSRPTPAFSFPDHRALAHGPAEASYAGSECFSCGTMNVSFTVR